MFDKPAFAGHESVHHFFDAKTGLRAIIAIHSTARGPSAGGCRMWNYATADEAFIDADGTLAPSGGCCKQGVDIAYDGTWGYHPLVVSLANTAEPLFLVNRSGNRPSHEHADIYLDKAAALCRRAGFKKITFRGDSKFSQTTHLDRWDRGSIRFIFGIAAMAASFCSWRRARVSRISTFIGNLRSASAWLSRSTPCAWPSRYS